MIDRLAEARREIEALPPAMLSRSSGESSPVHGFVSRAAVLEILDSLSPAGLDELRALSDAATPGPWHVEQMRGKRDGYIRAGGRTVGDLRYRNGEPDAAFIVAAVNYVRARLTAESGEPG